MTALSDSISVEQNDTDFNVTSEADALEKKSDAEGPCKSGIAQNMPKILPKHGIDEHGIHSEEKLVEFAKKSSIVPDSPAEHLSSPLVTATMSPQPN